MRKQHGVTLIGFLLLGATMIVFGVLLMRIIPVYLQNYEVKHSIKTLSNLKNDDVILEAEALKQKLMNQLYINGLNDIKPEEVSITPTEQENRYLVTVKYDVIKPLITNISLLFKFNESQEVTVASH